MKLLNLDELKSAKRQVQILGTSYDLVDQSVGGMIDSIGIAERSSGASADDAKTMFQDMVNITQSIMPGCPVEVLRSLSMNQIRALLEFASASDEEVVEGSEVEGSEKK